MPISLTYAALALVLGANLGSAINPIFERVRRDNPASYRLPLGNLVNRLAGVLLVTSFLHPIADHLRFWQPDLAKATADLLEGNHAALRNKHHDDRNLEERCKS
jgi:Na+/phosphate symporter